MTKVKIPETRVRIAPSPTGFLHIGTARTALFNWLFARHKSEGKFILRIEDTDLERSEKRFEDDIVEQLEWLGLKWDEFYKQSDRTKIYSKYIQKILDGGKAFWCYHSEEELEKERQEQMTSKKAPVHYCSHKFEARNSTAIPQRGTKTNVPIVAEPSTSKSETNSKHEIQNSKQEKGIIRLVVDQNSTRKIKFNDIIRGEIEFEERLLGDISIAKDLQTPLYHFAAVVDDYEMDITHVIRGEDHIANTAKHILIQEALGFDQPEFAHLPMILALDKSKLSKRHGATSVAEYRELGYLPDALVNYMVFLGWTPENPTQEILTKNEMIEQFDDLSKIHKSGAVFNIQKLNWINSQYIKTYNDGGLAKLVQPFVKKHFDLSSTSLDKSKLVLEDQNSSSTTLKFPKVVLDKQDLDYLEKISPLFRERLEYLDQVKEFAFFFKEPEYDTELLKWKNAADEQIKNSLAAVKKIIEEIGTDDKKKMRERLDSLGQEIGDRGLVYWPFRVALTGLKASPDPVDMAWVLGKEKTLTRIKNALGKT